MLAAVRVEGRVAGAERRGGIIDGEIDKRDQVWPVVLSVVDEGPQHILDDPIHALDLAGGIVVVRRPKNQGGSQHAVEGRPRIRCEPHVVIGDSGVGQSNGPED